jgi:ParB-like chromosome segregation protein Spo0J
MSDRPVDFPCLQVRLVPTEKVVANDYNPNHVAAPEMALLRQSIEADGVTQPIVVWYDAAADRYPIIDGFHRFTLLRDTFRCPSVPVVVLDRPLGDRMASTIRHNRARGRHGVELMGALVAEMRRLGWTEAAIATALGMSEEELLRLQQIVGVARLLAADEYSSAYGRDDEPDDPADA